MKAHLEKYHPDLNKEFLMLVTKANLDKVKLIQSSSISVITVPLRSHGAERNGERIDS
jgi:hypothetical protein